MGTMPVATKEKRILVVEDDRDTAEMLSTLLELEGYQATLAHNGEEAIMKVWEFKPHLIVLDIMMPRLDGHQVAEQLRKEPDLKDIPILVLTARSDLECLARSLSWGANGYLQKPFRPSELLQTVANHLIGDPKEFYHPAVTGDGGVGAPTCRHILLILGLEESRRSVKENLEHAGFHVEEAESIDQAIYSNWRNPVDLILLNESETTPNDDDKIRKLVANEIPVYALTNSASEGVERLLRLGVSGFVLFPFRELHFVRCIRGIFHQPERSKGDPQRATLIVGDNRIDSETLVEILQNEGVELREYSAIPSLDGGYFKELLLSGVTTEILGNLLNTIKESEDMTVVGCQV